MGRVGDTDLHKLFVIYLNPPISVGVDTVTKIDLVSNEATARGRVVDQPTLGKLPSKSLSQHKPSQNGQK